MSLTGCHISIHQHNTGRLRCYDAFGPFFGSLPRLSCETHGITFRFTSPELWEQIPVELLNQSLIFFPETVISTAFMQQVV